MNVVGGEAAHYQTAVEKMDAIVDFTVDTIADALRDARPGGAGSAGGGAEACHDDRDATHAVLADDVRPEARDGRSEGAKQGSSKSRAPTSKCTKGGEFVPSGPSWWQAPAEIAGRTDDSANETNAGAADHSTPLGSQDSDFRERWADTEDDDSVDSEPHDALLGEPLGEPGASGNNSEQEEPNADAEMLAAAIKLQKAWWRYVDCRPARMICLKARIMQVRAENSHLRQQRIQQERPALVAKLRAKRRR